MNQSQAEHLFAAIIAGVPTCADGAILTRPEILARLRAFDFYRARGVFAKTQRERKFHIKIGELLELMLADDGEYRQWLITRRAERLVDRLRRELKSRGHFTPDMAASDRDLIFDCFRKRWEAVRDSTAEERGREIITRLIFAQAKHAAEEIGLNETDATDLADRATGSTLKELQENGV
jgi:hypothetical protein